MQNKISEFAQQNLSLQRRRIEEKLESLDRDELSHAGIAPSELGSRSWEEDIRTTRRTIKQELNNLLGKTTDALLKIKQGIYGKCESCGKQIEEGRLKIMPTADLCLTCTRT